MKEIKIDYLSKNIHEKHVLAQAITLIESQKKEHQILAEELLESILVQTGRSIRIGISGVPGVGKSTLINQFGLDLISKGHKVAVLAIDPSSEISGGSILGDKTRMMELSQSEKAFIRPSPNKTYLGGVGQKTRETIMLCEAAGYDVILVETVGVGQSEIMVSSMVDCLVVLMLVGAGDELQGIKKGLNEVGDIFLFTKADGENKIKARQSQVEMSRLQNVLSSVGQMWKPQILTCSAYEKEGMQELWAQILEFKSQCEKNGEWLKKRQKQTKEWVWSLAIEKLKTCFTEDVEVGIEFKNLIESMGGEFKKGQKISVWKAAGILNEVFFKKEKN